MNAVEIIRKKRDGGSLTSEELTFLMDGYVHGNLPDYQMSAFLMATVFRGMTDEESADLTEIMLRSGTILDLSDIPGQKIDKHSTGGVADTVSLLLAPLVASCGVKVPMISGRGLGHTGGTLDKLETIPGFRTGLSIKEFCTVLSDVGVSMIGQTSDIAPLDKKLYALRDVTATIESPPLIAGSIMSKKLAAGLDALVLDIKTGNGAFMKDMDHAVELARRLVAIGEKAGKRTVAYITDMDQPLGSSIGNWLEVEEAVRGLRGEEDEMNQDLLALTHVLAGTMLFLGNASPSVREGIELSRTSVQNGNALRTFHALLRAHGADPSSLEPPGPHHPARHSLTISADRGGYLGTVQTHALGMCSVLLGAGRTSMDDVLDPMAGIIMHKRRGMKVKEGETLATAFSNDNRRLQAVSDRLRGAFELAPDPPPQALLIRSTVTRAGIEHWTSSDSPVFPS